MQYQYHQDWNYEKKNFRNFTTVSEEEMEQFLDEINNAEFVDLTGSDIYSLNKKQAHLYFTMKDGTVVKMRLFEDGYLKYANNFFPYVFIKIKSELFDKIFSEATLENYIYEAGK